MYENKPVREALRQVFQRLGLLESVRRCRREIHTLRQNLLSREEIEQIYTATYHENAGYGAGSIGTESEWEPDEVIKSAHAKAILQVWPLKKVLIGGCSSGMAVVAFRRLGSDAWGFDMSPDLETMVLPEARPFVRMGKLTAIPFSARDEFDALITTDVLEHVQLKDIDKMLLEFRRIGFKRMAQLINHTRISPDHMTLKPLPWWEKKMNAHGFILRRHLTAPVSDNPRIYGLNGDPDHVYTFWERR
jgi:hypothetical protein